ncbi:probable serine/threonine-protein kinase PIX13 isoform X2 [Populus nigra]|uniref:probable serine/threonine-protein kinase PIX13 isoform X2 n=1 Tax=Populus nigra TaxID=3691 RepID=UPI002B275C74|nr:probable serine/threonine-protein kinase PIX13 isoform X2 [Populus nigra]
MSRTLAAILGGAAGVMALAGVVIFVLWCLYHKKTVSRTSETGSSETSIQGSHAGIELSSQEARRFEMEELGLATKGFSEKNLIGLGKFGEVYKGLLNNGMIVAIKKRPGAPSPEFVDEDWLLEYQVRYLSPIQHRNLVTLLGYCQENNLQFLVYEYISSGSVSNHLYGVGQTLDGKLEFKLRLSIAHEAAKGLAHLHSQTPRLLHKNFKTANVLVDENFIAKVADAGLRNFLGRVDIAGPSTQVTADEIFLAPEVREFRQFSEKSDVFSFGVFLLELLSGKEATEPSPETSQNLVEWVQNTQDHTNISSIVDHRLGSSFTAEGMEEFIQLMVQCVEPSSDRRPLMSYVVMELDRILEKERNLTTVMGEGTPTVTLGSQLFRPTK